MTREAPRDLPRVPLPEPVREVYLIGIGGTGMGSLAGLLAKAGFSVRGSDEALYPPMSDQLAAAGIPVAEGFAASNLDPAPDVVVIGNVCRPDNPEAIAVWERGLPFLSMPEALARFFLAQRRPAVITGTHGKTTTSALLAHLLTATGQDPSFLVGGVLNNFGVTHRLGRGPVFVVEGDEYDTAFFDKGPKFLHYAPQVAAITSLEFDHADIYDSVEQIEANFTRFAALLPPDGALWIWSGAERALTAAQVSARCPIHTYGVSGTEDLTARILATDAQGTRVEIVRRGQAAVTAQLAMIGTHNVLNGLAALGLAGDLGVALEAGAEALSGFAGVRRRQEFVGQADGVLVIDDFAHHPTAVAETIAAVRATHLPPDSRLWALFEPRSNTARRKVHQAAYCRALAAADFVRLARPFNPHQLPDAALLDISQLVADLAARGVDAQAFDAVDAIVADAVATARAGDVLLVMSNGGFGGIQQKLMTALGDRIEG